MVAVEAAAEAAFMVAPGVWQMTKELLQMAMSTTPVVTEEIRGSLLCQPGFPSIQALGLALPRWVTSRSTEY